MKKSNKNNKKYQIKVEVNLLIDLNELSFPTDDKGNLIWDPIYCINDYISHGLFKGHDASYMTYIDAGEAIQFEDWKVEYPPEFEKELIQKISKQ